MSNLPRWAVATLQKCGRLFDGAGPPSIRSPGAPLIRNRMRSH